MGEKTLYIVDPDRRGLDSKALLGKDYEIRVVGSIDELRKLLASEYANEVVADVSLLAASSLEASPEMILDGLAISEPEERYRALFNSMTEGFALHEIICDDKGEPCDYRFLDVNPAFERLTGLKREDVIGTTHNEILPDDDPTWVPIYGEVALTGKSVHFNNYSPALDRHYEVFAYCPAPRQFAVMFTDVTERKRAEQALREANERAELAQRAAGAGIWDWTVATGHLEWSPEFFELFGLDPRKDTAAFDTWNAVVHPEDLEIANSRIEQALREHTSLHSEYRIVLPDGQLRWISALGHGAYDEQGQPVRMTGICTDITERKAAEDELRKTQNYLDSLLNYANAPIIVWDPDFRITRFNAAFERLTGYSAEEVIGQELSILFPPESCVDSLVEIEHTAGGEYWESVEIPIQRKDGAVRIALWNSANLYADDGRTVTATIAQGQDITERKSAEEELHRLNRTLKAHSKSDKAMMRATNEADYLREVCRIVVEDCGHAMVWIGYAEDDEAKSVRPVAYSGFEEGYLETLKVTWADTERGRGPTGTAIRTGKPSTCRNMLTDPKFLPWRAEALRRGYASSLVLPLIDGERAFGAITIYSREPDSFTQDEVTLLTELANDLAYGISAIRLRAAHAQAEEEVAEARAETERRAAELHAFISSSAEGMSLMDSQGNLLWMNYAGRAILGIGEDDDLKGLHERISRCAMEGDRIPPDMSSSGRALRGETVTDMRSKIVNLTSGKEVIISASSSPVRDPDGRIVGATNVFHDITAQADFERRREELYEREHNIAEILQQVLVPEVSYHIPGCDISVEYEAALEEARVGGDFYDVFEIGGGKFGILIGDVVGKGLAAAIRVAEARHSIRSYAYLDPRPSKVMTLANHALCRSQDDQSGLTTAFFAVLDIRLGIVTYANAGHPPPMVLRVDGSVEELGVTGLVIGVAEDCVYDEDGLALGLGDVVVMITDGITEARPGGDLLFGAEGVLDYLSQVQHRASPEHISAGLLEAAKAHAGGSLGDDAAILAFRITSSTR